MASFFKISAHLKSVVVRQQYIILFTEDPTSFSKFLASMIYLITTPFHMHPGTYQCEEISSVDAATIIKEAAASGTLRPYVNFGSTRFAIQKLCGIKVELLRKISLPLPADGDVFIDVRLRAGTSSGQIGAEDLKFVKVFFRSNSH